MCERTAVCRIERGPDVNSCSSSCAISNSLGRLANIRRPKVVNVREVAAWLCQQFPRDMLASVYKGNTLHILDLCVRHDVAVLGFDTTFPLPRESVVEFQSRDRA